MKTYLLYVRKYNTFSNDYILRVYKVTTDNIYRIIGKMYCTSIEAIERIDFNLCCEKREEYWKEKGYEIINYYEPKLSEDL